VKSSTLTLSNIAPFDEGLYDVVVTGRAGTVTSRRAQLKVDQSRLINLSARANVGAGENALFAGFVLANDNGPATSANWTVLARAAGPALKSLGVNNYLGNPSIDLYQVVNGQQVLQANNDNWSSHPGPCNRFMPNSPPQWGPSILRPTHSMPASFARISTQFQHDASGLLRGRSRRSR